MRSVKDIVWKKDSEVKELMDDLGSVGFQSINLYRAQETIIKMKKNGAKIFLTFTSNMVTSGLRGFFAQLISLGIPDVVVTTAGSIEEDIMRAKGEEFIVGDFYADDISLYEKGMNRVGNLYITNESYCNFEDSVRPMLEKVYANKKRISVSSLLHEIGGQLDDKDSILYQANKNNIPVFCPGITDGAIGFHLWMFQQKHNDFIVDIVKDFSQIVKTTSHDDKKGLISLGGGISKHHAILAGLLTGGLDYAVYMTTSRHTSGSMSGATTKEAKSWGKVKDDSDIVTVIGDVTITFPLMMFSVLDKLSEEGFLDA